MRPDGVVADVLLGQGVVLQDRLQPPQAHDHNPIRHFEDFRKLGGDHQDRGPFFDQLLHYFMDLVLGPDIDAPGGLIKDKDLGLGQEPLGDDHLLLVAAAQVPGPDVEVRRFDPELLLQLLAEVGLLAAVQQKGGDDPVQGGDGDVGPDPVVLIDQVDESGRIPSVTSDNRQGISQAVDYLVQLNHARIGFVTGPLDWITAEDRFKGYRETLTRNGLEYDESLVFKGDFLYESGIAALEYFLSLPEWPTAILCSNDQMALGILNKAQAMNISIPNDISLVGFDGLPLFGLRAMGLTTVKQDIPLICKHAVELLTGRIEGREEGGNRIVPTQLIIGNTCKKIDPRENVSTAGG